MWSTTLLQGQFHSFLFFCFVLLDYVLWCDLPPFIISSLRILFVRNTEVLLPNFLWQWQKEPRRKSIQIVYLTFAFIIFYILAQPSISRTYTSINWYLERLSIGAGALFSFEQTSQPNQLTTKASPPSRSWQHQGCTCHIILVLVVVWRQVAQAFFPFHNAGIPRAVVIWSRDTRQE